MSVVFAFIQVQADGLREHKITNIFNPLTTPAKAEFNMAMLVFAITGTIFAVVAGLIIYTLIRFRRRREDDGQQEPPQVYGSNQIEAAWTVVPILIVFVLAGVAARTIWAVEDAIPPKSAVHVTVTGRQYWWEVHYPYYGIVTANEIHIPVSPNHDRATYFELRSTDVIHSLWVPELGGKTDLIPNRINHMWMDPSEPGVYWGNCTEFCGVQHANMLLEVVAEPAGDFDKWVTAQQQGHNAGARLTDGQKKFQMFACSACHAVKGTRFAGKLGPDLTHFMSRRTLGSGVLPNTEANLRAWIANPQESKPGCLMPSIKLTGKNLDDIVAYMQTLE